MPGTAASFTQTINHFFHGFALIAWFEVDEHTTRILRTAAAVKRGCSQYVRVVNNLATDPAMPPLPGMRYLPQLR
jgi:hypothetical protein